ncbi:ATP/GTP-binding protein [Demequina sp. NBRC 110056]|uniref:GTP-binding protein n=1 Tax=Demequina sp. NBRC 110056 TaxID=1570345 RepID=UPI000A06987B|nr:ATP/GTP-binding protein [Demequina sp. NBRC 110056]
MEAAAAPAGSGAVAELGVAHAVVKVVVAGPFGAGKTTFVRSACPDAVGAERSVSDGTSRLKEQTTVAMDHGTTRVGAAGSERVVTLFGTPGQERFSFMWPLLAQGMAGYVVLVDASRLQSLAQAKGILRRFAAIDPAAPFVVAVNRWDRDAQAATEIAGFLGVAVSALHAVDPRDGDQARAVLAALVERAHSRAAASPAPAPAVTEEDR